jgi:hypothetical protein
MGTKKMDRDTIIRLARESGIIQPEIVFTHLERFAALVAVQVEATWQNRYLKLMDLMKAREGQPNKPCCLAEREACAKVCDELEYYEDDGSILSGEYWAKSIRARGKE